MYPACATPDHASIRFVEFCEIAPAFPITIVVTASAASAGPQSVRSPIRPSSKKRSRIANAAALVATAMNVVIGVGAPWYTSGVHWWNGATEALNASPVAASAIPVSSSGSSSGVERPIACPIVEMSVEPVAP